MNLFTVIQATLAPVVLISAIGLINLSMYNRYGRIHDRIRHLLHDIETLTSTSMIGDEKIRKRKICSAKNQIEKLLERGKLLKWSLLLLQFSLIGSVADAILIFLNTVEYIHLEIVIIMTFGLCVLLILMSAILTAVEISKSLKGLYVEIEAVTKN